MYVNVINIHPEASLAYIASRLDEIGRPAWIGLTLLGFWFWWPLGLVALAFGVCSRRWNRRGRWQFPDAARRGCGFSYTPPSGNRAFDEYRAETLRRLEEEQKEFVDYLERLRQARDKAEFDQFMADRRRPPAPPEEPRA